MSGADQPGAAGAPSPALDGEVEAAIRAAMPAADLAHQTHAKLTELLCNTSPLSPQYAAIRAATLAANDRSVAAKAAAAAPASSDPNLAVPADPAAYGDAAMFGIGDSDEAISDFTEGRVLAQQAGLRVADVRFIADEKADVLGDPAIGEAQLKAMFGTRYDERIAAARAEVARVPGFADWLERTGYGNSPRVVVALLNAKERRGGQ
jgi:hypothetical protein